MSLTSDFIEDFESNEPDGATKKVSILDNHIRMMKRVLFQQLGSLGAANLTVTAASLNWATGISSGILEASDVNVANGLAPLDVSGLVPLPNIPTILTGKTATTCSGNSATASQWLTARAVTFIGDVTGTFSIDGSVAVPNITLTVGNDSHTHDTRYFTETESDGRFAKLAGLSTQVFSIAAATAATHAVRRDQWALYNTGGTVKMSVDSSSKILYITNNGTTLPNVS